MTMQRRSFLGGIGAAAACHRHQQIVPLAARHRVPTIYANHDAVAAGGLMSYASPLKTAKAMTLDIPATVLALADEVIE